VVLELGPGLGVSVTELLQDQLLGKGPGHSKPVEGQKSFTNELNNWLSKWKKITVFSDALHCG
jgi:hypothetical protein